MVHNIILHLKVLYMQQNIEDNIINTVMTVNLMLFRVVLGQQWLETNKPQPNNSQWYAVLEFTLLFAISFSNYSENCITNCARFLLCYYSLKYRKVVSAEWRVRATPSVTGREWGAALLPAALLSHLCVKCRLDCCLPEATSPASFLLAANASMLVLPHPGFPLGE